MAHTVTCFNNFILIFVSLFVLTVIPHNSYTQNNLKEADIFVKSNLTKFQLVEQDFEDVIISDNYISKHNGVNHIYYQQTYGGIPVEGAILNVNILPNKEVLNANSQFVPDLNKHVSGQEKIDGLKALDIALADLKIKAPTNVAVKRSLNGPRKDVSYSKFGIISEDPTAKLTYIKTSGKEILLTWETEIYVEEPRFDVWKIYINVESGEIIKKVSQVLNCKFEESHDRECTDNHIKHNSPSHRTVESEKNSSSFAGESYRVYDFPIESPNHGVRTLVTDPANLNASPFGWHDTDGVAGAEYTITRGNNVYAQDDENGNNGSGYSPDGGASLLFDYTLDLGESPNTNTPAAQNLNSAITNLFYWNNIIHDVYYEFGFDEVSGNFQQNNYGKGGAENDYVLADALDGSDSNNARFFTSPDGTNGRMEMYLWTGGGAKATLDVNTPGTIEGSYQIAGAEFGANTYNVTGNLVIVDDNTASPSEGCNALTNGAAVNGNIAIIDRGTCQFGDKALNAQNAGAIAVIVCNNVAGSATTMSSGVNGGSVTIPTMMISQSDCATIKIEIGNGVNVTMVGTPNPDLFDGSYDNGIIAHEYGHGISTRLTGGPATNACLTNSEQGGEGWSDFFGLVLTHEPGDTRNTSRGIGTYIQGQSTFGGGIRPFPYTTDMSTNPTTYDLIKTAVVPHGIGSVLCTMLWDLYWDLIDAHGYNSDLSVGGSGNHIAIQLVMDGLKMQPCNPGFVDVRDAILAADIANNNGANQCIIWNTFARRGLGLSATQGNSNSNSDGTEAFDMPDGFINVDETIVVSELYEGEIVTITSEATCKCGNLNNVEYKHILPPELTILSVDQGNINGNEIRSSIVNLTSQQKSIIEYTARMALCESSASGNIFEDDVEGGAKFTSSILSGSGEWVNSTSIVNSPSNSWYGQNFSVSSDYALTMISPVLASDGTTLSFFHRFDTEESWDGGVVEISTDNGATWSNLGPYFSQNGHQSSIAGNAGTSIQGQNSFTGSSNLQFGTAAFIKSTVELNTFSGQNILIRFHFASDTNTSGATINGWYIDDIVINSTPAILINAELNVGGNLRDNKAHKIIVKDLDQSTIFVDKLSTGKRYGGSWKDAFLSVQDALAIAACNPAVNEIWVRSDTYYPSEDGDQTMSFRLVDDVSVYGGFSGSETMLSQRDISNNVTILSGDIGIVDMEDDNSYHVIDNLAVNNSAILDGFTIKSGNTDTELGAGMRNVNSSPTLKNCIFTNNYAESGGAISNSSGSVLSLENCTFLNNNCVSGEGRVILNTESVLNLTNVEITDTNMNSTGSTVKNVADNVNPGTILTSGTVLIKDQ